MFSDVIVGFAGCRDPAEHDHGGRVRGVAHMETYFDGWDYRLRAENTILEAECREPVADVMVPAMEQLELF